jgi:hypothetical protein
MSIMPIWAWIIFFIIGGIVYLVRLPKRNARTNAPSSLVGHHVS